MNHRRTNCNVVFDLQNVQANWIRNGILFLRLDKFSMDYVIFGRDREQNTDGQWKCHHEIYYDDCLINPKMYFSGVVVFSCSLMKLKTS